LKSFEILLKSFEMRRFQVCGVSRDCKGLRAGGRIVRHRGAGDGTMANRIAEAPERAIAGIAA